ncbi:hypothetical protein B9479_000132 [Cryptococcus floricola]|uniref:Uncharacterized protein n=1 Tax=Cryptococcus floricola TaxID=2591691 RepID=A0A5D3BAK4_9TREE|nr:hypothetical protein B9479_000132 [Cryptococcus floricola]
MKLDSASAFRRLLPRRRRIAGTLRGTIALRTEYRIDPAHKIVFEPTTERQYSGVQVAHRFIRRIAKDVRCRGRKIRDQEQ